MHVTDYTVLLSPEVGTPSGGPASLELSIDGTSHLLSTDVWMDELEVSDAEVLGRYCSGPFEGAPAITMKRVGAGRVIYVGASLDDAGQDLLIGKVLSEAGVTPGIPSPDNVEIIHRVYENVDHWFILNYGTQPQEVRLPTGGIELLTGKVTSEMVTVNALDALVICSQLDV